MSYVSNYDTRHNVAVGPSTRSDVTSYILSIPASSTYADVT